jgi:hypothetical protein
MMFHGLIIRAAVLAAVVVPLASCSRVQIVREQVVRTEEGFAVPGPFAPRVMRVHPLTHAELDRNGDSRIVLHVELKDSWGDTVKGVGKLQVQLRSESPNDATVNPGERMRWDIDLRTLDDNVSYFDSATRTYRVILGGLPSWLDRAVREDDGSRGRIRVLFRTVLADKDTVVLQDEYVLR